jgi:hypothetical protein
MDSYPIVVTNPDSKKVQSVPYDTNPGFVLYESYTYWTVVTCQQKMKSNVIKLHFAMTFYKMMGSQISE